MNDRMKNLNEVGTFIERLTALVAEFPELERQNIIKCLTTLAIDMTLDVPGDPMVNAGRLIGRIGELAPMMHRMKLAGVDPVQALVESGRETRS